ncbi:MAG: SDR family NAD(P)-dependent oxidoreductase, partial [Sphingobacteriaceae bacterium]
MEKAIILGATSGIGHALVQVLISNGYKVGAPGRRVELLNALKEQGTEMLFTRKFDISDTQNINNHLEAMVDELGGLDLLVISAGFGELNAELSFDIEERTIQTNVTGFTAAASWAFNYFKNRGMGHIVGITSIAGIRGSRHAGSYNASKAYQINYLEGLKQQATHLGLSVTVTDIRPGFVDTAMAKGDGKFWVATPEKAAKQIYHSIKSKRSTVYVTRRWVFFAFVLKALPSWLYNK